MPINCMRLYSKVLVFHNLTPLSVYQILKTNLVIDVKRRNAKTVHAFYMDSLGWRILLLQCKMWQCTHL